MILFRPFPTLALAAGLALLAAAWGCGSGGPPGTPDASPTEVTPSPAIPPGAVVAYASASIRERDRTVLSRIDIVPRHPVVTAGETLVFSVLAYDAGGRPLQGSDLEVRWRMTDSQAGVISHTGIFHAGVPRGVFDKAVEVTVTQELPGKAVVVQQLASVSIVRPVSENDLHRVEVLPSAVQAEPNTQLRLTPLALDRAGAPVPGVDYTWEMLDSAAGTIDAGGQFTASQQEGSFPGAIRVVAQKRSDPNQTVAALVSVTVQAIGGVQPPTKVNLYPQAISLRPRETMEFNALALDPLGNLVDTVETSWKVLEAAAGSIDSAGVFTAGSTPGVYANAVEVTVSSTESPPFPPLTARASLTVLQETEDPDRLQEMAIAPLIVRLRPGESLQMTASTVSSTGQPVPNTSLEWRAMTDAVEVSQEGLVTARNIPGVYAGAVQAVATSTRGGQTVSRSAEATVIVLGPLDQVTIVPESVTLSPNQTTQFSFIAYDVNGVRLFDVSVSWEIVDPAAGTIDGLGYFTAGQVMGEYEDAIMVVVTPLQGSFANG